MIQLNISFALLAIVAGMLLLAKTKKEELGGFFKAVSWFVIVLGFLLLICNVSKTICRMRGCSSDMMNCEESMQGHWGMHRMIMREGECKEGKMECCDKMKMHGCPEMMEKEEMKGSCEMHKAKCDSTRMEESEKETKK